MGTAAGLGDAGRPKRSELTWATQGCSSIIATSTASVTNAITNEVPPVTSSLDRARQLVGQLRQVGGQGGEVVQSHCGKGRATALVELVQVEPARDGVSLQGPQDGVAVVIRRPQCLLRHGARVLDNSFLRSSHGKSVIPVVSLQPIEGDGGHGFG